MALRGLSPGMNLGQPLSPSPPAINRLDEIRAPTLVIVGDLDAPDIQRIVARVLKKVPGARKAVIKSAAHMVNMEQPAEFNRIVLDFVSAK